MAVGANIKSYLVASSVKPRTTLYLVHLHAMIIFLWKDRGSVNLGAKNVVAKCLRCGKDGVTLFILKRRSPSLGSRGGRRDKGNLPFFLGYRQGVDPQHLLYSWEEEAYHLFSFDCQLRHRSGLACHGSSGGTLASSLGNVGRRHLCSAAFIVGGCLLLGTSRVY